MEWTDEEDDDEEEVELPVFDCEGCHGEWPLQVDTRLPPVNGQHEARCMHCNFLMGYVPADDLYLEEVTEEFPYSEDL